MTNFSSESPLQLVFCAWRQMTLIFLGIVFFFPDSAGAQTAADVPAAPIQITSNQLISDTENNQAEFIGNVVVIQDDTRITADRLKIFFAKHTTGKEKTPTQSMEKLLATGNVNIKFDNRLAVAKEALYTMKNQVLILKGPGATVTSGSNTISGDTITFYRNTGRFTVEGKTGSQVRAVLLPEKSENE